MTKIAIYARVRTSDKSQIPENQLRQLRRFCKGQAWQIVDEYVDHASGAKSGRKEFNRMFQAASRRAFDILLFWSLDRFSREGIVKTLQRLNDLAHHGVKYRSLQEPYIDTTHPFGDLLAAFVAKIAEMERQRVCGRLNAGLEKARAQGKQLGRPRIVFDRFRLLRLREEGKSYAQIAEGLALSGKMAVYRTLRDVQG